MVKCSYEQKPFRREVMRTYGASVTPSPSMNDRMSDVKSMKNFREQQEALAVRFQKQLKQQQVRKVIVMY